MKDPRNIVLTGASGGLGRALSARLAAPGRRLLLFGRDADRLEAAADLARGRGAQVQCARTPLEDHDAFATEITRFEAEAPVDLFLANAGVKCGNQDGIEPAAHLRRVIEVNLTATALSVQTVLPGMRARGRGQVALVSSLAAVSPQGTLLSYSASKAGVAAYATALRRVCAGSGVSVHLIQPGFVDTPMTDRQLGPTPFKITAEAAARRICRGLERNKPRIAFPHRLVWLIAAEKLLPTWLADRAARGFDGQILPDADEAQDLKGSLDTQGPE
ncbi:MAG: SDR family NAD(P)-dependent oxidoreductase [Silicimonas sp.]|nr:SDR family NAD(P)-dependent oxidoreductase [Silicimonas sp.]